MIGITGSKPRQGDDRSPSRRAFFHGLASLPLIGGGIALIGQPTGSAEPITEQLLNNYQEWLSNELVALVVERSLNKEDARRKHVLGTAAGGFHYPNGSFPMRADATTRAAIVLSAVGCDWRTGSLGHRI